MQYRWSPERAEYQFACAVDRTHQTFRDSMAEWTRRHFAALIKDAREAVWDGEVDVALPLFDAFVEEIGEIHRSAGAQKIFDLRPLVSEVRNVLEQSLGRSPSWKSGVPPDGEAILAKADEMHRAGMTGRQLAAKMRFEAGFDNVSTVTVRELTKGRWKPTGRPKKGA